MAAQASDAGGVDRSLPSNDHDSHAVMRALTFLSLLLPVMAAPNNKVLLKQIKTLCAVSSSASTRSGVFD